MWLTTMEKYGKIDDVGDDDMGLLNSFKKLLKDENAKEEKQNKPETPKTEIKVRQPKEGVYEIEFYDSNEKFGQSYNTTKLIINDKVYRMGNSLVNNGYITWYKRKDARGKIDTIDSYERIVLSVDINKMLKDKRYCSYAMKNLLGKRIVKEYIEKGKSEEPQAVPCGNYIGGISIDQVGNFIRSFDNEAGKESHNSPYMVQIRIREKIKRKQEEIVKKAEDQAQIKSESKDEERV